jgi:hypothetical protein
VKDCDDLLDFRIHLKHHPKRVKDIRLAGFIDLVLMGG